MQIICIVRQRDLKNSSSIHQFEIYCVLSEFLFSREKLFFLRGMRIAMCGKWKRYEVVTTKASMKAKLHVHRIFIHIVDHAGTKEKAIFLDFLDAHQQSPHCPFLLA